MAPRRSQETSTWPEELSFRISMSRRPREISDRINNSIRLGLGLRFPLRINLNLSLSL